MTMNRRNFIKYSSTAIAAASFGGLTSALTSFPVNAADAGGYKALVCLFLYGGMDNHDTIIPYDVASYQRWSQIRASLISAQGDCRQRANLLSLNPRNHQAFGRRQFALPPELSGLHQLFESGNAAIMGNVGPIIEPTTAADIEQETVRLPSRLFSHNDQQATWMAGEPEGARYGWGGLFSDALVSAGANSGGSALSGSRAFSTITTGGGDLLITGRQTAPYQIVDGGALQPDILEEVEGSLAQNLSRHFRAEGYNEDSFLRQDMAAKMKSSFDANQLYRQAVESASPFSTPFPENGLGQQLMAVAQSISIRHQLGTNRQVYMVAMGGFDTHSGQAQSLPGLQRAISDGVMAFHNTMVELGISEDVTLFTASDFGRTLAINGDGTDHGWGGHHFVIGGGVQGRQIYGDIPEADFGHSLDAGSGRLIPTMGVEQYAASLGLWMGIPWTELEGIFPNLNNLGTLPALFG